MICVANLDECPITGIQWDQSPVFNAATGEFTVTKLYEPTQLPISTFKFSTSIPCISHTEQPSSNAGQLTDEYTYSADGCTEDDFYNTSLDSRFMQVDSHTVNQGELEDASGITDILNGRFHRNDETNYQAIAARQQNELNIYQRPVIGWKLECENDADADNHFSR